MKHQFTDVKPTSNTKAEADECLFEYLHGEMVNYVISKTPKDGIVRLFYHHFLQNKHFKIFYITNILLYRIKKKIFHVLNGWDLVSAIVSLRG